MATQHWRQSLGGAVPQVAPVTVGLAVAAATELLILRTFTRTAIHIPALEAMREPYEALTLVGRYAYYLSVALLMLALPTLAYGLARDGRRGWPLAAAGIGLFGVAAGAAAAGLAGRLPLDLATLAAVVLLVSALNYRWNVTAAVPFAMLGVAFVTGGGYTVLQSAGQQGTGTIDAAWLLTVGEYSGAVFALSLPLLVLRRIDRVSAVTGLLVGLLAFGMLAGEGAATSRFLLLWNVGLSGTLPATVYAAGAGALALTFMALFRSRQVVAAMAVILLVAGGMGLHNTYQTGLVVAGLAALCLAGGAGAPTKQVSRPTS